MSDSPSQRAPLVSILGIFVLLGLFAAVVYYVYVPRHTGAFPDDGIHSAELRQKNLAELRAKQARQLASYGWVDQKAGVMQLPLERAEELTLRKYASKP